MQSTQFQKRVPLLFHTRIRKWENVTVDKIRICGFRHLYVDADSTKANIYVILFKVPPVHYILFRKSTIGKTETNTKLIKVSNNTYIIQNQGPPT
jgi:predicted nucleic-acid-binding Zn-ribbon protein